MLHKQVISDAKEHNFKIESITLVKMLDSYNCDVVAKDSKGHRSYRVKLDQSSHYPHSYKIREIKGQRLVSNYQWRGK